LQAEFLSVSPARVKTINRALYEAGIFVLRDNEQGKRYGRRGPDGRIIEAFGFDLSPLALRYDEFVRIAATAKTERSRMKDLRRRVTIGRRAIRQAGEALADLGLALDMWPQLEADTAALVAAARKAERSDDLALITASIERRQTEAESALREASKPVETSPEGLENKPHTITTTLMINPSDTVIANDGSSQVAEPPAPPSPPPARALTAEKEFRLSAGQLLDLAPRLAACIFSTAPNWGDIVQAAEKYLRPSLGISATLWGEACRVMGRDQAALALAIVSTKADSHFTSGAGGYFAGMVRKAGRGELRLERTLWALKDRKWGAAKGSRDSRKGIGNEGAYGPH
jgi:replication initiation protein RepC